MIAVFINMVLNAFILYYMMFASYFMFLSYELIVTNFKYKEHLLIDSDFLVHCLAYAIIILISLSSTTNAVNWIYKLFINARKLNYGELEKIKPILLEVINKVNTSNGTNYNVNSFRIMVNNDIYHSFCVLFGDTIILSSSVLYRMQEVELKGVLSHAIVQLDNKYGYIHTILYACNIPSLLIIKILDTIHKISVFIIELLKETNIGLLCLAAHIYWLMLTLPLAIIHMIFRHILLFIFLSYNKFIAYRVDRLVYKIGYREELVAYLNCLHNNYNYNYDIISVIRSSEPTPSSRILMLYRYKK